MSALAEIYSYLGLPGSETYKEASEFGKTFPGFNKAGPGDAARHAYASAKLARYSPFLSRLAGGLNEFFNVGEDQRASAMDEFNNEVGRSLSHLSDDEIKERIIGMLNEGKGLKTLPSTTELQGYASGGKVDYNELSPAQLPGALFDPVPEGMSDEGSNKILSALKQIQLNGSLATGSNQYSKDIGYGGRVGWGTPMGDDGYLSAGISGQGHRAKVNDVGTFANSQITGGDLSYSTPKHSISARFDLQGMSPSTMTVGPYSAADAVMSRTPFIPPSQMPVPNRNAFQVNYRRNFAMGGAVFPAAVSPLATLSKRNGR